ncbi:phosphoglycerate dehydrogenase [Acetivibrio mesophilus]|uniref:D-3-phosphoglycerate dehydrogenase n=1 Tax=Acetivibrio mesophilus TaxID=2487273 RepID=A0A4Q0I401_9FIRM|nr:phosphoglycerate dehydrogenase [Acetivibrio mesophilus]ODM27814.1 3-phosphoglycerate dehydrogenase [Clostridium sp. Bc-iso-3]RXE59014.1 3-phosphoglycerate dehydrogenase [Acetivibrio mesophilus]HHV30120.1 phosphoglycerate dehydrogenase [Clostridium sp.]
MYTIQTLNKISLKGLELFPRDNYEIATEISNPDAVLVRSYNMLEMDFSKNLKAIARAGAGVNNIPVDKCTEKGIVVFNTPGANANAVKELVLASLFLSSRKVYKGISWAQSLKGKGDEVAQLVEKGKSQFAGPEIKGKKLGVIGLGAIGVMVANDAVSLGMEVIGYDPFISIDSAWELSSSVEKAMSLDHLISTCDYITIHVPYSSKTSGMINKDKFDMMKKGVRLLNFARGGLVVNKDLLEAIDNGTVACYVTDFPEDELLGNDNIITLPHLGASTPESEENCAVMAASQLRDFLEFGNIKNSVNFPNCELPHTGNVRIIAAHDNIPNMFGQITSLIARNGINIGDMISKHKDKIGYTILNIEGSVSPEIVDNIKAIEGVRMVRVIEKTK